MGLKEEIIDMKNELEEVKIESLAKEMLSDYKKANKRMFIIWIVTFIGLLGCMGYIIYLLNDIGYTEETTTETIDIDEVEQIDNSDIKIGDDTWEKSDYQ